MKELSVTGECKYLVKINNKNIQYKTLPCKKQIVIDEKLVYYLIHHDNLYKKCKQTFLLNADISITNPSNEKKENIYFGLFHNKKNIIKSIISIDENLRLEKCKNGFYKINEMNKHSNVTLKAHLLVTINFNTPKTYEIDANIIVNNNLYTMAVKKIIILIPKIHVNTSYTDSITLYFKNKGLLTSKEIIYVCKLPNNIKKVYLNSHSEFSAYIYKDFLSLILPPIKPENIIALKIKYK